MGKSGPIDLTDASTWGHVLITDTDTGEVLLDQHNAIHSENLSVAIARALSGNPDGHIYEMHFGNGGSTVSGTGSITYLPPNTESSDSDLYNTTYFKIIDESSPLNVDPSRNSVTMKHVQGLKFSDIIIKATLEFGEPAGQQAFDDTTNLDGEFVFDEIGLKTFDVTSNNGLLISHVIFSPIQKSLNRQIQVLYTIRVQLG